MTLYCFGDFRFDSDTSVLAGPAQVQVLRPKTAALLQYMLDHAEGVLPKHDLLTDVWQDTNVSDNTLAQGVRELRTLLGDDARQPAFIQTVPGKGYVWLVRPRPTLGAQEAREPSTPPPTAPRRPPVAGVCAALVLAAVCVWWVSRPSVSPPTGPLPWGLYLDPAAEQVAGLGDTLHDLVAVLPRAPGTPAPVRVDDPSLVPASVKALLLCRVTAEEGREDGALRVSLGVLRADGRRNFAWLGLRDARADAPLLRAHLHGMLGLGPPGYALPAEGVGDREANDTLLLLYAALHREGRAYARTFAQWPPLDGSSVSVLEAALRWDGGENGRDPAATRISYLLDHPGFQRPEYRVRLLTTLAAQCVAQGRPEEAAFHLEDARMLALHLSDRRMEAHVVALAGHAAAAAGDWPRAEGLFQEARALNRRAEDRFGEAFTLLMEGSAAFFGCRTDESRAGLARALQLFEALELPGERLRAESLLDRWTAPG